MPAGNIHYGYMIGAAERAYHERDFGDPDRNDKNEIVSAERRADGTLPITINFASLNQLRQVVFARSDSRIRAMYSRGPQGEVTVENGIFRHHGQPTPWQHQCR